MLRREQVSSVWRLSLFQSVLSTVLVRDRTSVLCMEIVLISEGPLSEVRDRTSVLCMEVVLISECPLSEVPLY